MKNNEMKNNEELEDFINTMEKTSGKENTSNFMDMVLGLMVASGSKDAKILQTQKLIYELVQENLTEKYVLIENSNKQMINKIDEFLTDIKNQIINFTDNLNKEENQNVTKK